MKWILSISRYLGQLSGVVLPRKVNLAPAKPTFSVDRALLTRQTPERDLVRGLWHRGPLLLEGGGRGDVSC